MHSVGGTWKQRGQLLVPGEPESACRAVNRSVLHVRVCMRGLPRIVLSLRVWFKIGWVTELSQRANAGKIHGTGAFWKRVWFWSKALHVELNPCSETSLEVLPLTSTGIVRQSPEFVFFTAPTSVAISELFLLLVTLGRAGCFVHCVHRNDRPRTKLLRKGGGRFV